MLNFASFQALEKAKEAGRKERMLVRQRETMNAGEQINLDLTYSVSLNLFNLTVQEFLHRLMVQEFLSPPESVCGY